MTSLRSFRENFLEALAELHHAESQLLQVLPVLARTATSPGLKSVFKTLLGQTRAQALRLERILTDLGEALRDPPDDTTAKLIASARESTDRTSDPLIRDAMLIAAAQDIEHHAIGAYGRARTYARLLGLERANELLYSSLHETALASVQLSELGRNIDGSPGTLTPWPA